MKLFTIGDSLSQGFMSAAAARTDLCYSTLIARTMGLNPGSTHTPDTNYFYPEWPCNGLPANIEAIFRHMIQQYGSNITGLDWLTLLKNLNQVLDESEDYYERGDGSADKVYPGNIPHFNNVSIWSANVADSWLLTPEICAEEIEKDKNIGGKDQWLGVANQAFYRTALKVLNPNLDKNFSQLDWLHHHAQKEGVESLILWLGSNNALKPILTLKIIETPGNKSSRPYCHSHSTRRRKGWNLWRPSDFKEEYTELIRRVDKSMFSENQFPNPQVFIGTIPRVFIVPVLKGFGPQSTFPGYGSLHKYYTYVPFEGEYAMDNGIYFPVEQLLHINQTIDEYNNIIKNIISEKNKEHGQQNGPYHVVDLWKTFNQLHDHIQGRKNGYRFPEEFQSISPRLDVSYYHADKEGKRERGGLISLDGIHPTAIGQGLIADEFIKVMKSAGIQFPGTLDWKTIFNSDSLFMNPISMMHEIYSHKKLAQQVIKMIRYYL